ncbi:VanZ family protein [Blautia hydrogenotrophica]|uniref:VanZ family protein n=1 Tax=Blautia hydrogenotrophica TaxID=53443 RepID=UPI002E786201|nr:VanZ family protein [Blautia hydrogenotrophica]MEE0463690.1 VanZ family protein [Blautia hydrogenotrophica]
MNRIIDFLLLVGKDMLEPIGYLPWGMAVGGVFLMLWEVRYHEKARRQKRNLRQKWSLFFCVVYLTVLLKLALFSREPGSRMGIDLELFGTWNSSLISQAYFIENIIMFIPFGFLFPLADYRFRDWRLCVGGGCVFSMCLELVQLVTQRGFCQLDDVITNTVGTLVGWVSYRMIKRLHEILCSVDGDKNKRKD